MVGKNRTVEQGPEIRHQSVKALIHDRTLTNGNNVATALAIKAGDKAIVTVKAFDLSTAAVVPLMDRRDDRFDGSCSNLTLMAQGFNEQLLFPFKLISIREVLPLTAATLSGDRANRHLTTGSGLQYFKQFCFEIFFFRTNYLNAYQVTNAAVRNKNDSSFETCQTGAAIDEGFHSQWRQDHMFLIGLVLFQRQVYAWDGAKELAVKVKVAR